MEAQEPEGLAEAAAARERRGADAQAIERAGGHAVPVVCDMSDLASVRRAAAEIIALHLPIVGLLNFLIGVVVAYQGSDYLRFYGL